MDSIYTAPQLAYTERLTVKNIKQFRYVIGWQSKSFEER
jgi:hypothetical protein